MINKKFLLLFLFFDLTTEYPVQKDTANSPIHATNPPKNPVLKLLMTLLIFPQQSIQKIKESTELRTTDKKSWKLPTLPPFPEEVSDHNDGELRDFGTTIHTINNHMGKTDEYWNIVPTLNPPGELTNSVTEDIDTFIDYHGKQWKVDKLLELLHSTFGLAEEFRTTTDTIVDYNPKHSELDERLEQIYSAEGKPGDFDTIADKFSNHKSKNAKEKEPPAESTDSEADTIVDYSGRRWNIRELMKLLYSASGELGPVPVFGSVGYGKPLKIIQLPNIFPFIIKSPYVKITPEVLVAFNGKYTKYWNIAPMMSASIESANIPTSADNTIDSKGKFEDTEKLRKIIDTIIDNNIQHPKLWKLVELSNIATSMKNVATTTPFQSLDFEDLPNM